MFAHLLWPAMVCSRCVEAKADYTVRPPDAGRAGVR
jgi:hypothetical protein